MVLSHFRMVSVTVCGASNMIQWPAPDSGTTCSWSINFPMFRTATGGQVLSSVPCRKMTGRSVRSFEGRPASGKEMIQVSSAVWIGHINLFLLRSELGLYGSMTMGRSCLFESWKCSDRAPKITVTMGQREQERSRPRHSKYNRRALFH